MATQTIQGQHDRTAADLEALFPGRFLSVTSFKRDGTAVATPVWAVSDGKRLYALTDLRSAKIRRIRRNPRVLVAPCRVNGKLRGEPLPAQAEVLTAAADLERVQHLLLERYKVSYRVVMLFTGSGAVCAAGPPSPTAPRWRSRSNRRPASAASRADAHGGVARRRSGPRASARRGRRLPRRARRG